MVGIGDVSHQAYQAHQTSNGNIPQSAADRKARDAAKDFEAVALTEMFSPMFKTLDGEKDAMGGNSNAEQQYRGLQVQELAQGVADAGGIGIAKSVYGTMRKMQEQAHEARKQAASHHVNMTR